MPWWVLSKLLEIPCFKWCQHRKFKHTQKIKGTQSSYLKFEFVMHSYSPLMAHPLPGQTFFSPFYSTKQNNLASHPRPCLQQQDSNTHHLFILRHIFSFPSLKLFTTTGCHKPFKSFSINAHTESSVQKPRNDKAIKASIQTNFGWRHLHSGLIYYVFDLT